MTNNGGDAVETFSRQNFWSCFNVSVKKINGVNATVVQKQTVN